MDLAPKLLFPTRESRSWRVRHVTASAMVSEIVLAGSLDELISLPLQSYLLPILLEVTD